MLPLEDYTSLCLDMFQTKLYIVNQSGLPPILVFLYLGPNGEETRIPNVNRKMSCLSGLCLKGIFF